MEIEVYAYQFVGSMLVLVMKHAVVGDPISSMGDVFLVRKVVGMVFGMG